MKQKNSWPNQTEMNNDDDWNMESAIEASMMIPMVATKMKPAATMTGKMAITTSWAATIATTTLTTTTAPLDTFLMLAAQQQ